MIYLAHFLGFPYKIFFVNPPGDRISGLTPPLWRRFFFIKPEKFAGFSFLQKEFQRILKINFLIILVNFNEHFTFAYRSDGGRGGGQRGNLNQVTAQTHGGWRSNFYLCTQVVVLVTACP